MHSQAFNHVDRPGAERRPRRPDDRLAGYGLALLAVAAMLLWLHALGRPAFCSCGSISLWSGASAAEDSSQFSDWYSLLHASFGMGLLLVVRHFQPHWPLPHQIALALWSSTAWEAVENMPWIIAAFDDPSRGFSYGGDTLLNALGDSAFVLGGFLLARRLSLRAVLLVALLIEGAVGWALGDGLLLGSMRLIAEGFPALASP